MAPDDTNNKLGASPEQISCPKNEEVIDDEASDVDDEFASLQRSMSAKRRDQRLGKCHIQDILHPIPFVPLIRPLGISDLPSAVALENAAFTDPEHRASADKVYYYSRRELARTIAFALYGLVGHLTCHVDRVPTDSLP